MEDVGYLDTVNYNFYAADGDVIMRLNECGWKSVAVSYTHLGNLLAYATSFSSIGMMIASIANLIKK